MKRFAPAAERNAAAIAEVLKKELPATGLVLEVASGTGQHAAFLASEFPDLCWQPSDADPEALASIAAWRSEVDGDNLLWPLQLDAANAGWPLARADAALCINMVHISPWRAAQGLFAGAARLLPPGAPLILYGPYLEGEVETVQSNIQFNRNLEAQNPDWGLRKRERVDALAESLGFRRTARYTMPTNNLVLVYRVGK